MTSQKLKKFLGASLLKPKPILRIGVSGRAIARLEIFKNLMSFKIVKVISTARFSVNVESSARVGGRGRLPRNPQKPKAAHWLAMQGAFNFCGAACARGS
jgi:hypothetical protein